MIIWCQVCQVHLIPVGLDVTGPEHQVVDVARRVSGLDEPVIVLGDFDLNDQSWAYTELSSELQDAYREAGFCSQHFYAERAEVACAARIGSLLLVGPARVAW